MEKLKWRIIEITTKKRKRNTYLPKLYKRPKIDNTCDVCKKVDSKYKCPNCKVIKYCSLNCYKIHKNNKCVKPNILKNDKNNEMNEDIIDGYIVKPYQYNILKNDLRIKQALSNKNLQNIIKKIDKSNKPEKILENLMKSDEQFSEFIDYMLTIIKFKDKSLSKQYDINNKFLNNEEKLKLIISKDLKE